MPETPGTPGAWGTAGRLSETGVEEKSGQSPDEKLEGLSGKTCGSPQLTAEARGSPEEALGLVEILGIS